jgi:hypothetical protein
MMVYALALVALTVGVLASVLLRRYRRDEVALAIRTFAEFRHALDPTAPWARPAAAQPPQQGLRTRASDFDLDG